MTIAVVLSLTFLLQLTARHVEAAQCACATSNVHVRSGPDTDHSILHTLPGGDCLPYRGDTAQGSGYTWYHLDYNGQIVTRAEWGAREAAAHIGDMPDLPIYVFLHHGAGGECFDKDACMGKVRGYQNFHIDGRHWSDIGYNFVVGEDGNAYEARGWRKIGAHTRGYNTNGIAISVIGDFTSHVPNDEALATVRQLIQCGLDNHVISQSYTLKGHRDVGVTACPGDSYYALIQSWPHFVAGDGLYVP